MLNKKEKMVMSFLYKRCVNKKSSLLSPQEIINSLLPKYEISNTELDSILDNLVLENYIELVHSNSKGKLIYCISLKSKGESFERSVQDTKKRTFIKIGSTIIFACLSFAIGLILRAIFKK